MPEIYDEDTDAILDEASEELHDEATVFLAGTVAGQAAVDADLTRLYRGFWATLSAQTSLTGQVICERDVQGTTAATSGLTASLTKYEQYAILDEAADEILDESGETIYDEEFGAAEVPMAGTVAATSTLASGPPGLVVSLAGKSVSDFYIRNKYTRKMWRMEYALEFGVSSFTASLGTIVVLIRASLAASSSLIADKMISERDVLGTIAATSALTADLYVQAPVAGTIAATSALTAQISLQTPLAGSITTQSTFDADLEIQGKVYFNGLIAAASSAVSPQMIATRGLGARAPPLSVFTGQVVCTRDVEGTISASASLTARLDYVVTGYKNKNLLLLKVA